MLCLALSCLTWLFLALLTPFSVSALQANGVYLLGMQLLALTAAETHTSPNALNAPCDSHATAAAPTAVPGASPMAMAHPMASAPMPLGAAAENTGEGAATAHMPVENTAGGGAATHVFLTLRFIYSMERNRKASASLPQSL
jgi:hypothetical protein